MSSISAKVISVHASSGEGLDKPAQPSIEVALDGVVGDRHRSFERETWATTDKQPGGTRRRNERQWSAVSVEELAEISAALDLVEPLKASDVGANLCIEGVDELSRLPKGTLLKFPSGAELLVEEFNPPCRDMGESIADKYATRTGEKLSPTAFSKAAKLTRGVLGVVDVPGVITAGDEVTVEIYRTPAWLVREAD